MRLDDGEDSQKSMTGALCSLLVVFIVLAYSYLKIDVLSKRKDVDILTTM